MKQPAYTVQWCRKNLAAMRLVVHDLWVKTCLDVGVDPAEKFVISGVLETSKYHKFYDIALKQYWDMKKQFDCGGYI